MLKKCVVYLILFWQVNSGLLIYVEGILSTGRTQAEHLGLDSYGWTQNNKL